MPNFREVGAVLKDRFDGAAKVSLSPRRKKVKVSNDI